MMKCIDISVSDGKALLTIGVSNNCRGCYAYDDGMCVSMTGCPKKNKKESVPRCPHCGGKL